MKKILPISLLALCCAMVVEERASAWVNSRFGIGANWSWQSGGNNLLWGLFRDGQPCGPDFYCQSVPVYPRPGCNGCGYPGAPGFGGPGFGAPGFPGAPVPPGAPAPVSTGAGVFDAPNHAIQAPTAPAPAGGAQPVSFYHQSGYGYYYPIYRTR
jgi:hypothetical protein